MRLPEHCSGPILRGHTLSVHHWRAMGWSMLHLIAMIRCSHLAPRMGSFCGRIQLAGHTLTVHHRWLMGCSISEQMIIKCMRSVFQRSCKPALLTLPFLHKWVALIHLDKPLRSRIQEELRSPGRSAHYSPG